MDNSTLFKLEYGLYVLTARDGDKDNGCIINTVLQVTSTPSLIGVIAVNKQNYTHDMIMKSKEFNISVLTVETPFEVIKRFGFQSGGTVDKFSDYKDIQKSKNGNIYLTRYSNAYLSFQVTDTIDFGSHTMFRANITDGEVIGKADSLTYAFYQRHIKQRSQTAKKTGYQCTVCDYIYEGEIMPENFICPTCKHGASDFIKISDS